jgi:putative DNA primase/helicase
MIPVRGCDGILRGLQFIGPDGSKRFKTGTEVTGGYHAFGKPDGNTILICEGQATGATLHEVTGHAVAVAFNAGNLCHVVEALHGKYPGWRLIVCADDDHGTEGNPGMTKATDAALAVGCLLAVPKFPAGRGVKDTDFNDLGRIDSSEAVRSCIEAAAIPLHPFVSAVDRVAEVISESSKSAPQTTSVKAQGRETLQQSVNRLAALDPLEYERVRKGEAERLGDLRVTELDKAVKMVRKEKETDDREMFPDEEPCHEAVDGLELVKVLVELFERFSVLPKGSAITAALWTILTYVFNHWRTLPLLTIVSPEKRCGKTTFLTTLSKLCYRPLPVSNISPAALYRAIEAFRPALLIDEGDSFLKDNEELRGVINSGHTKDAAFVIRCEGDDHKPVRFSTWCPKSIAMIGNPPDTIQDRSIMLHLRRKLADERTEAYTEECNEEFASTRAKILRWVTDNDTALKFAKPERLNTQNDRQADNWMPILAIAKVLKCETAVREAALLAAGNEQEELPARIQLLCDIREVFEIARAERISSADLVKQLVAMEDRPWCEWKRGYPLTPNSMARLLKAFDIQSKQLRIGDINIKGYALEMFTDAFIRYTSPIATETTKQVNNNKRIEGFQSETRSVSVSVSNSSKYSDTLQCFDVSVASEGAGADGIDASEVPDFGDDVEVRACRA